MATFKKIKIKIKGDSSKLAEQKSTSRYHGPCPPRDVYAVKIKRIKKDPKLNKNGDVQITSVCEINEPKDSARSKYNGAAIWGRLTIQDDSVPYVNAFLNAISGGKKEVRKAFWAEGFVVDEKGNITKIGSMKIDPTKALDGFVAADVNRYKGKSSLQVIEFLEEEEAEKARSIVVDEDEDEDEDDAEDEDENDDDEDEDNEDENEDGDDEGEEDEDGDEETEEEDDDEDSRREELEALGRKELVEKAKEVGIKKTKGVEDSDLIDAILEAEPPF